MNTIIMSVIIVGLLSVLFVAYSYFAYRYARYSAWNATWQGIVLQSQKITLAAFVLFFIIDTLVPESYPGRYSILVILLTLLAVEAWATLLGLLHVQRRNKRVRNVLGLAVESTSDTLEGTERKSDDRQ